MSFLMNNSTYHYVGPTVKYHILETIVRDVGSGFLEWA